MTTVRLHNLLGLKDLPPNGMAWHDRIVEGFEASALESMSRFVAVPVPDLLATLREEGPEPDARLSISLSNGLYRLARALRELQAVNGGKVLAAYAWLQAPQSTLKGRKPIELLLSQLGAEFVSIAITRLAPVEPEPGAEEAEAEE